LQSRAGSIGIRHHGNLIKGWGGPGYVPGWPAEGIERPGAGAEHAILVDREGNVWLGGSARGDSIQKFTGDGKFLWEFGHRGPRNSARAASAAFEAETIKTPILFRRNFLF